MCISGPPGVLSAVMTKRHWVVVGIGLTVVVVGVFLGISAVTLPSGVSCGGAWSSNYVPYFASECSEARSGKGLVAAMVVGVGVLIAAAGAISAYLTTAKATA